MNNAGRDAEAKTEAWARPMRAMKQQVTKDLLEGGWYSCFPKVRWQFARSTGLGRVLGQRDHRCRGSEAGRRVWGRGWGAVQRRGQCCPESTSGEPREERGGGGNKQGPGRGCPGCGGQVRGPSPAAAGVTASHSNSHCEWTHFSQDHSGSPPEAGRCIDKVAQRCARVKWWQWNLEDRHARGWAVGKN